MELLRNALAHAQDIVTNGLETIVDLSSDLDDLLHALDRRRSAGGGADD